MAVSLPGCDYQSYSIVLVGAVGKYFIGIPRFYQKTVFHLIALLKNIFIMYTLVFLFEKKNTAVVANLSLKPKHHVQMLSVVQVSIIYIPDRALITANVARGGKRNDHSLQISDNPVT